MKIARVRLRNWRCFSCLNLPVGSRLIITGPCGSGKTSFLDALGFIRDLAQGASLEEAVNQRGGLARLRNLEARFPETDIALEVHVKASKNDGWIYRIRFGEEGRCLAIKEELIWHSSALIIRRPDREDKKNSLRRQESSLSPRLALPSTRHLTHFFSSFRYEDPQPQLILNPDQNLTLADDSFGRDFFKRIAQTSEKLRLIRFSRISEALQKILPGTGEVKVEMDGFGRWHLFLGFPHWRPRASWQRATQIPAGLIRLIAIFWSILELESLLLIEEPEIGLHPEAISQLPRIMQDLSRKSHRPPQLIITTHHPALWPDRLVKSGEIVLLIPERRGTKVVRGLGKELVGRFLEKAALVAEEIKPWLEAEEEPWLPLFPEKRKKGQ